MSGFKPRTTEFSCNVRGTQFADRQETIEFDVKVGDRLLLELDPNNPVDTHAVKVLKANSQLDLGYIPKEKARNVGRRIRDGQDYELYVAEVFTYRKGHIGVRIEGYFTTTVASYQANQERKVRSGVLHEPSSDDYLKVAGFFLFLFGFLALLALVMWSIFT